jgi:hypothetical protein
LNNTVRIHVTHFNHRCHYSSMSVMMIIPRNQVSSLCRLRPGLSGLALVGHCQEPINHCHELGVSSYLCPCSDSGEYLCSVAGGGNGPALLLRSFKLTVSQLPAAPAQPKVQDLKVGTSCAGPLRRILIYCVVCTVIDV